MKTYEGYSSSPDGWNVTSNLELENDGRFSYSEGWTDYTNASLSGGAGGTWRRGPGVVIFHTERIYDPIYFPWEVGREMRAIVRMPPQSRSYAQSPSGRRRIPNCWSCSRPTVGNFNRTSRSGLANG